MKVTIDLVKKYNPCEEGIAFMEKNFPNGAEVAEIARHPEVTIDMLHFAKDYFDLSNEEVQLYNELCKIKDSRLIFDSYNVSKSTAISQSNTVVNSSFVQFSENVKSSKNIYHSINIKDSEEVYLGQDITNGFCIMESNHVERANNIIHSNYIIDSNHLISCDNIDESSFIFNSDEVHFSHFCGFLNHCNNCMFCFNLKDAENCIFNKPVSSREYSKYRDQFFELFNTGALYNSIGIKEKEFSKDRFTYSLAFNFFFRNLPDSFIEWARSLPNANEDLLRTVLFI